LGVVEVEHQAGQHGDVRRLDGAGELQQAHRFPDDQVEQQRRRTEQAARG
jgi:hypothetical protein